MERKLKGVVDLKYSIVDRTLVHVHTETKVGLSQINKSLVIDIECIDTKEVPDRVEIHVI